MAGQDLLQVINRAIDPVRRRMHLGRFDKHAPAILLSAGLVLGAATVALCCMLEKTMKLPDDGRGFGNHYGIWAIFISSPLLVILVSAIRLKFIHTAHTLSTYTIGTGVPPGLDRKVTEHLNSLDFRQRTRYILWIFVVLGWYWWLVNVEQTLYPLDSYGNDVFDAYPHILGFLSFKAYLGFLWVIVYPFLAYWVLHVFISMIAILKYMSDHELIKLDFFHEDDCGGVSVFGAINSMILSATFMVFATVLAILFTHNGNYISIWSSVIVSFFLIVTQSFLGVYFIHSFVRQKKKEVLSTINRFLNESLITSADRKTFPQDLLAVRNHIAQIRSFPYARGAQLLVNFLRLSPAAAGILKLIWNP